MYIHKSPFFFKLFFMSFQWTAVCEFPNLDPEVNIHTQVYTTVHTNQILYADKQVLQKCPYTRKKTQQHSNE